jgi:mono/diheme cytochrome c family protein
MSFQIFKTLLFALIVILLVSGCAPPTSGFENLTPIPTLAQAGQATLLPAIQSQPQPQATLEQVGPPQQAALGSAIYLQRCSGCHGLQGEGVDAPALRNSDFITPENSDQIFDTISNGRSDTKMPAWIQSQGGPLVKGQIDALIAYLGTLQGVPTMAKATPMPEEPEEAPPPANAPAPEPARPSNPGDPGAAIGLTGNADAGKMDFGLYCSVCHGPQGREEVGLPNPGSGDGVVPELNPIDSTMVNQDAKVFATNIDLFIEHGSTPSGDHPWLIMPDFGDGKMLSDQQIADILSYLLSLNGVK